MGTHGYSERPALKSSLKDLDHLIGIRPAINLSSTFCEPYGQR